MSQVLPEGPQPTFAGLGSTMPTPGGYGEPAAAPTPDQAPPPEPEPQYAQIPAEEWQGLQQTIQQQSALLEQMAPFAEYLQQIPAYGQQQQQQGPNLDIWSDNPAEQIQQLIQQEVDQRIAPYEDTFRSQQLGELEQTALDQMHSIALDQGEFLYPTAEDGYASNDIAVEIAKTLYPTMAQQYGDGPRAEEQAYEQAYAFTKAYEQAIVDAHENRAQNQASTLAAAPREPGPSGGMPAAPAVTTTPGGFEAVLQKHFGQSARLLS